MKVTDDIEAISHILHNYLDGATAHRGGYNYDDKQDYLGIHIEAEQAISKLITQARIEELGIVGDCFPPSNKFNRKLNLYIDARELQLGALRKEES